MTNSLTIHEITNEMSTLLWHNIMNMISFYFKSSFLEKKYWLVPNNANNCGEAMLCVQISIEIRTSTSNKNFLPME